jgi:hypothetical protein
MNNTDNDLMDYTKETIINTQKHLESIREMVDISEGLIAISSKLNDGGILLEESDKIIFFNSLVTISKLDVAIILKNLLTAEFEWEKLYFIKQAHLTMHETLKTYDTHNKNLHEFVIKYPQCDTNYKSLQTDVKSFRKTAVLNGSNEIRNCTAHIGQDFKQYYDTLLKVDASKSLEMIAEFINLMDNMFIFSLQCLEINLPADVDLSEAQRRLIDLKTALLEKLEN